MLKTLEKQNSELNNHQTQIFHFIILRAMIFTTILSLELGCSSRLDTCEGSKFESRSSFESLNVLPTSITVPESFSSQHMLFDTFQTEGRLIYYGYNQSKNKIEFYNGETWLESEQLDKDINTTISSISISSKDSIFLTTEQPPLLFMLNGHGDVVRKWDVSKPFSSITDEYFYLSDGNNNKPIFLNKGNQIVFNLTRLDLETKNFKKDKGVFAVYDIKSSSWIKKPFGDVPKIYSQGEYPRDLSIPDIELAGDFIAVAFPLSHAIYFYDLEHLHLKGKVCLDQQRTPLNYKVIKNPNAQDESNYLITQPFFSGLHFNPETNSIDRVYFREQPLKQPNGRLNLLTNRQIEFVRINLSDSTLSNQGYSTDSPINFLSKFTSSYNGQHYINSTNSDKYLSLSQFKFIRDE
ncbi:hypothetical protein [Roseivirga sp.]|uniref:hypothetical protein n=1 Tax=Roseivirga sp. TaxID=1964215 RepID=UPI003B8CB0F7